MENTFLVSLSQQMASQRSMDVIANNLANLSTPAFKREAVQFEQYVVPVASNEGGSSGTTDVSFVLDRGVVRDLTEGRVEQTGAALDFAVTGNAYFVVQTPEGTRYTRNGHFTLDDQGRVVTGDGYAVQGEGGDITVSPDDGSIHVASDGTVSGELGQIGKLRLASFADERALKKTGSSLYDADGQAAQSASDAAVHQGMIEKSNVEPIVELTHMIEVMRAYQSSSDLTQTGQDLMRKAVEKLGQVPQS